MFRQSLRQVFHHGTHSHPDVHRFIEVTTLDDGAWQEDLGDGQNHETSKDGVCVDVATVSVQRLADRRKSCIDGLLDHAASMGEAVNLPATAWTKETVPAPNISDKATLISLAKMAANAYAFNASAPEWQDIGKPFNYTDSFGWEMDGIRGHVFADRSNSTVILAIKGTSMAIFDGTETEPNDKTNDNLFASCCCGEGQYRWKRVCGCMTDTLTCNSTCVAASLREKDGYYNAARDLYHNVTERYPKAEVWLVGHSLGGVVSSLLGLTYGLPVVTFEAYPDALAASRLGLPVPAGYKIGSLSSSPSSGVYHFGHTADPVFMGTCNTWSSTCSLAGYAMEGLCHTGRVCQYDTVGDLGWRSSVRTHSIVSVIKDVLEKYDTVPTCEEDVDCVDCYKWKYFKSNSSSDTTTSSSASSTTSSSYTRTRTETCKTPGWWGCRDETSTTTSLPTTSQSSSSSTSCKTPGWFGCNDPTTTTSTSTPSTSAAFVVRDSPMAVTTMHP